MYPATARKISALKMIKRRFGNVSPELEKKLEDADMEVLDKFGEYFLDFEDLDDVEKWWANN